MTAHPSFGKQGPGFRLEGGASLSRKIVGTNHGSCGDKHRFAFCPGCEKYPLKDGAELVHTLKNRSGQFKPYGAKER